VEYQPVTFVVILRSAVLCCIVQDCQYVLCSCGCSKQKQIFVAPHRRIEEKEEQQHKMEKAFEDLYMTATGYFMFCALF